MGAPTHSSSPTASPDAAKRPLGLWLTFAACCVIALGAFIYLVVEFAGGHVFVVPSQAMEPTIHPGDRIETHTGTIHRGDIVVYQSTEPSASFHQYVKRVIAVGGDTIEGRSGVVYLNGAPLTEPYVNHDCGDALGGGPFAARRIPASSYWVMGDNRCNSSDSRVEGPIGQAEIIGRVTMINVVPRLVTALILLVAGAAGAVVALLRLIRRAS